MSKDWASQRPTLWNAIASELVASDLGRLDCAYIYMRQNGNGHKPKSKDDAADDDDNESDKSIAIKRCYNDDNENDMSVANEAAFLLLHEGLSRGNVFEAIVASDYR